MRATAPTVAEIAAWLESDSFRLLADETFVWRLPDVDALEVTADAGSRPTA